MFAGSALPQLALSCRVHPRRGLVEFGFSPIEACLIVTDRPHERGECPCPPIASNAKLAAVLSLILTAALLQPTQVSVPPVAPFPSR